MVAVHRQTEKIVRRLLHVASYNQGCAQFKPYNGVHCTAISLVADDTDCYGHILSSGREYWYLSRRYLPSTIIAVERVIW